MSRKRILPAERIVGGIAVVLIIVAFAVLLGGCSGPLSGGSQATVSPVPSVPPATTPTPAATPSSLPTVTPAPEPTPAPTPAPEEITRTYEWTVDGRQYTAYFGMLKSEYDAYKSRPHVRGSDYPGYEVSVDERIYFTALVGQLMDAAEDSGSDVNSSAMAVTRFLQSMPNVSSGSPAYDDYPKYPVETLADGGGDSEDMSILAANLLDQMGYNTVLLGFPGHMAVGVQTGENVTGRYYTYNGVPYYYLEVMPPLRGLGDIPDEYRNTPATIYTMRGASGIALDMNVSEESSDEFSVYYHVHCNVTNGGYQTAQNVSVYFAALALDFGEDYVREPTYDINIGDIPAGEIGMAEATLRIPRSGASQIQCIASGDNFDPVAARGEEFSL